MARRKSKNIIYIVLAILAVPLLFRLFKAESTLAAWYNSSWLYRKQLYFNNSASSTNLSNFPVLVTLSSANFNFTEAKTNGEDIRFTDSDGTTLLSYEIESYSASSQTAKIWVKIPQINAASTSDSFFMYWGNSGASDAQDADNTWNSNYKGVYHLGDNAASTTVTDSSGNTNTITASENTNNGFSQSAGKIGNSFLTAGTPTYITDQTGTPLSEVYPDIVLDSNGYPVIAYTDFTNFDLKLVHCNDKECKGGDETVNTVDSANVTGYYPSLQLDSNGYPMIAYHYSTGLDLKYVHCNDVNCAGGDETFSTIESTNSTGWYPKMVLDSSGYPVIAYYYATGLDLKLVHCGNADCSSGNQINNVDTTGTVGNGYLGTDLVLDGSGYPVISYYDTTNTEPKIAHCNDANCAGSNESLTSPLSTQAKSHGTYTSIQLDGSGFPMVAYYNTTDTRLNYFHCDDVNCSGDESASIKNIDNGNNTDTVHIEKNSSGNPYIVARSSQIYPRIYKCSDTNCTSFTSTYLALYNQYNGVIGGFKLDANDNAYISSYSRGKTNEFDTILYTTIPKLQRAYDSDFDFGTSSFSVSGWFKSSGMVQMNHILSRYDADQGFKIYQNYGGQTCFGIDDDATWGPDDSACSSDSQVTTNVDNGNAASFSFQAMLLDSNGYPIIVYKDATNLDLEIIHCTDANCSGTKNFASLDSTGDVGNTPSMSLDSNGYPVITYYDTTNTALKIIHCGNANCSSGNTTNTLDGSGVDDVGSTSNLSLDSNGYPVISYTDFTNTAIKFIHCNDVNCSGGDDTPSTISNVGDDRFQNTMKGMQLDSNGYPIIVYTDLTGDDLELIHCNDVNCAGSDETRTTIDSTGNVGLYATIVLDSSGYPVIAYYDLTNFKLKLAHCGNADCNSGNTINTVQLPNSGDGGLHFNDLKLNANGHPVILTTQYASWSTYLVVCNDVNCSGGNETSSIIRGSTLYNYLYHSLALDSNSYPVIAMAENLSDLRLIHMNNTTTYTATGNQDDQNWHHVVGVKNGTSSITLYIDGTAVATDSSLAATGTLTSNSASLNLAEEITNSLSVYNWTGYLDEIQIDNTARSSDWVRAQYLSETNNFLTAFPTQYGPTANQLGNYVNNNSAIKNNLIAYYKFDEGYGTTAHNATNSGSVYDGTITGATWNNNGKYGKSLQYNGSTHSTTVGSISGVQTVSFWVNPSTATESLLAFTGGIYVSASSGIITATGFTSPTIYVDGKVSSTLVANQWQHITVTTTTPITASAITLGRANSVSLTGLLDEVKIYNAALTADEVKQDYNQRSAMSLGSLSNTSALTGGSVASNSASAQYCAPGSSDPCSPPIGEWNFEEGSGTTANDNSGNGNTGTITGATYGTGKVGKALSFGGGTDTVTVANSISTKSIEFWVNPSTSTENLIDLRTSATAANISVSSGTISASGFTSPTIYVNGIVSSTLAANVWQHVAITTNTTIAADAIRFGRIGSTSLTGKLDSIRIFDYARTPAQIAWDYNQGKPVAHWKMDECTGTAINDSSGNGNTGTLTIGASGTNTTAGTCTTSGAWFDGATGKFNSSMEFDGTDDFVRTSNNSSINSQTILSISAWVKTTSATNQQVYSTWDGTNGFQININSSGIATSWSNGGSTLTSTSTINDGSWHHLVGTWDGSTGSIYVDGKLVKTGARTGSASTKENQIGTQCSGANSTTCTQYFSGQIDDVRIYNYALTAPQIKNIYNEGSAVRFGP